MRDINDHVSIRSLRFSMRLMGMWPVEDARDQFISNILLFYTISTVMIAFTIEFIDFYYSWGNLQAISYNLPGTITVFIELVKLIKFTLNRSEVVNLNAHIERTFWKMTYETADLQILEKCNRKSLRIIIAHLFFSQCVVWLYVSIPIVESAGKNASDRTLPLALHFNFPYTQSPYYEILFILQIGFARILQHFRLPNQQFYEFRYESKTEFFQEE
ncbi:hypothetical protein PV328_011178 [Microctonus aethiopoides]|uniref:Uncharacterized protein n=1 Tax=Microctonus aethiopoides TaxID=144406 RepID=A0AA39C400_9HYME|nr:hypothetical protein PV328_011178 [Microctonus aethiopoides]